MSFEMIAMAIAVSGNLYKGFSKYQAANYQAKVSKYNASIADQNAARATERAQVEQQDFDNESGAMMGDILATQAASGLSVAGRSQVQTRKTAAMLNRKDALNIVQAGALESYNHRQEAANFRADAKASQMEGKSALISAAFDAAGSLMGSAEPTARKRTYTGQPAARTRSLSFKPRARYGGGK